MKNYRLTKSNIAKLSEEYFLTYVQQDYCNPPRHIIHEWDEGSLRYFYEADTLYAVCSYNKKDDSIRLSVKIVNPVICISNKEDKNDEGIQYKVANIDELEDYLYE